MNILGEVYGLYCTCRKCSLENPQRIRYVGITTSGIDNRLRGHLAESRTSSEKAKDRWIRKHGEENIRATLLETVTSGYEELRIAEIGWIAQKGTFGGEGLNMTRGGEGVWGYKFSEEDRETLRRRTETQMAVKHPRAKITVKDVSDILERLWKGESPATISEDYPVSSFSIQKISDGVNWVQVPRPIGPRNKPANQRMSKAWATRRLTGRLEIEEG